MTDRYIVTASLGLNARLWPDSDTADTVVKTWAPGAIVRVLYTRGSWAAVAAGDGVLYSSLKFLRKMDAPPSVHQPEQFKLSFYPLAESVKRISQPFAANPQNYQQFNLPGHEGTDHPAKYGEDVMAAAAGKIYKVHRQAGLEPHNWGGHVRIEHDGGYKSIYCHLSQVFVNVGDEVEAGQVIGKAGNTGNVWPRPTADRPHAGTHLHFVMKHPTGKPGWPYQIIDPTPFLRPLME